MSAEELEELNKKIARKDATIHELSEQLQASPDEKQQALNDLFGRIQDRDWEIRKLSDERGNLSREVEDKNLRILRLLRMQAEASAHVSMCNLAMEQLGATVTSILGIINAGAANPEEKLGEIRMTCEAYLAKIEPPSEEDFEAESVPEQASLPIQEISAEPAA